MGEIADMMLDGTLCEACGEYIGDATGYPGYCSEACANDRGLTLEDGAPVTPSQPKRKAKCPECGKRFKEKGLPYHRLDVHGVPLRQR